eukprot:COSAG03_NODE_22349_length_292_cov_0.782383_1_plen_61_part_10
MNDVGAGGETRFTDLKIDVKPKRGMGLVFFPGMLPSASENAGGEAKNVCLSVSLSLSLSLS